MREFARIERLRAVLPCHEGRFGIGDDAAILGAAGAVTTDTMVEGVHFDRAWSDWADVGYKLVASNVSDVLAMGASAETCLLNLALPSALRETEFEQLLRGIREGIDDWFPTLKVCGGDTTSVGESSAVLSMTVIGRPFAEKYWFRDGARDGDRLWADGPLGLAATGLMLLAEGHSPAHSEAEKMCVHAHRRPSPPDWIRFGAPIINEPTAAIDVSDGLVADLGHVLKRSGLSGARLIANLPGWEVVRTIASAERSRSLQLAGGDDYIRVVTASEPPGDHWTEIGVCTNAVDGVWFTDGVGDEHCWDASAGYEHFSEAD